MVIFLFGLGALFTRGSRAQLCAVCSLPQTVGCYWLSCLSNQFLLAPTETKPVYYSILSPVWALGKSCFSACRHPHSLAQSSYIMSLYTPTLMRVHLLEAAEKYNKINHLKKYYHLPCPHKGMVVSVQLGQLAEHVVIWTHSLDTSSLYTQARHR
jgi:hypothetical protein